MDETSSQKQTKNEQALRNTTRDIEVASRWVPLNTFSKRLIGLMGRKQIQENTAYWIYPCPSIHTFFMLADIDVVFLDQDMKVIKTVKDMTPWRVEGLFSKATSVVEGAPGLIARGKIKVGDQLELI